VPDDVVQAVSRLSATRRAGMQRRTYPRALLREQAYGKRIYHAILADYILEQISKDEKKKYHKRAVQVYREKLARAAKEQTKPDALSAMRLLEHVLATEDEKAFVDAFVNECTEPLLILGLLDTAISFSERVLQVVEKGSKKHAMVLGNLGLIYAKRGELNEAERMYGKSLEITEQLGLTKLVAHQYSDLGIIYRRGGNLDKAEKIILKALQLHEELRDPNGVASDCLNLGGIYYDSAQLDKAERTICRALEIHESLRLLKGVASDYGNLGLVYAGRGDLDKAEQMYKKSLEIDQKLGRLEGMASQYANLGLIYEKRGDNRMARQYGEKAQALFKKIGMQLEVKKIQGWIDGLKEDGGQRTDDGRQSRNRKGAV